MTLAEMERERDKHIKWGEMIKEEGRNLTKWELDFVDSVLDQMGNGRFLSIKQAEILERIYAEKTP